MFTKRHHEAVADALELQRPLTYDDVTPSQRTKELAQQWDDIVRRLANMFVYDNDRFRRIDFYKACHATRLIRDYYSLYPNLEPDKAELDIEA